MSGPVIPQGYGSPDAFDENGGYSVETYDLGFGSPEALGEAGAVDLSTSWGDSGYGAPLYVLDLEIDPTVVPNNGGTVLTITVIEWPFLGDHTVTMIDQLGNETPCHGLRPGEGEDAPLCRPVSSSVMRCGVPRLAVGLYTVRVSWLSEALHTVDLVDALEVVYHQHFPETYVVRSRFQAGAYDVGVRAISGERIQGA